ncbi:FixH family protein [Sinorhizobium fredii]|uniref:Nitrogen fixation protein FixH n=1 Tax=Rhizobium fredii TaxID=380 RepID=A0A2L0HBE3_RHIFR|nr:FixH family protein [Sinorhizobium fredii]AUX78831.1 nitrogen fixation protein FixH [Sinorhizobium fredii]
MSGMITKPRNPPRGFTGWHMVAVMSLFFGTIISVNVVLAWNASRSWSGLVVQNAYIASQQFNGKIAEARHFAESGIVGRFSATAGELRYVLARDGKPLSAADRVLAVLRRPVEEHEDLEMELAREADGVFLASLQLNPGQWIADLKVIAGEATIYRQAVRFAVAGEGK